MAGEFFSRFAGSEFFLFNILYAVAQLLGITAILLIGSWMAFFRGGFGFQDHPENEFRFHPMLMGFAMLLLNGEAILIYRGFRQVPKIYTKPIHGAMQLTGLVVALLGLKAVLDSHNYHRDEEGRPDPKVNFYSLHSWIGISAVTLFATQFAGGFLLFFKPGASLEVRQTLMPAHRLTGIVIFIISLGAALMGVAELSAWSMTCWLSGKVICGEMLLANLFGVTAAAFAAIVLVLVAHPAWIRQPLPSEVQPPAESVVYIPN